MHSSHASRLSTVGAGPGWSRLLVSGLAGLLSSSLLIVTPVYGQEGGVGDEELECTLSGSGPDEVDGENQAREEAEACGVEVEVLDERTEFGEVYALPDGSMRASSGVEPVRAVDDSGEWAPIDTTLEYVAGGTVRPVNVAVELEFSGGGDDLWRCCEVTRANRRV